MNKTHLCGINSATKHKATVVNFIGAPGAGKSTNAAALFSIMKKNDINAELINEYAKDCVWREAENILKDQIYIFAKQHNKMFRLRDKVDYIISDSPLLLNIHYGTNMSLAYEQLVLETFQGYNNITFFVERNKPYNPKGRLQTSTESDQIAIELKGLLQKYKIPHIVIKSDIDPSYILKTVMNPITPLI